MALMKRVSAIVFVVFLSIGCATRGDDFFVDFKWIKKDVTTKDDVLKVLGDPTRYGYSSGQPTWTYGYYRYRLFGEFHTKRAYVLLEPRRTGDSFSFSSSFPEDVSKGASSSAPAGDLPHKS